MTRDKMKALVHAKREEWRNRFDDIDEDGLLEVIIDSLMVPVRDATAREVLADLRRRHTQLIEMGGSGLLNEAVIWEAAIIGAEAAIDAPKEGAPRNDLP